MGFLAVGHATSRLTVLNASDWTAVSGTPTLTFTGRGVAFSPNGALLAVAHTGSPYLTVLNTVDWTVVSGTPTLAGNGSGVAFSPDGSLLAVAHTNLPRLRILNTSDWTTVSGTPTLGNQGSSVAFSPDGALLAVAYTGSPYLRVLNTTNWTVVSGTPTLASDGYGVAFSPDGSLLAVVHQQTLDGSSPCLRILNTSDWTTVSGTPALAHTGRGVAFSPDGSLLAVAHEFSPYLRVLNTADWTTVSGTPILEGPHGRAVAFSPDGSFLAVAYTAWPYLKVLNTSDWTAVSDTPILAGDGFGVDFSFVEREIVHVPAASFTLTALAPTTDPWIANIPAASFTLTAMGSSYTLAPPRNAVVRTVFRAYLTATGEPDLELPISSFQARNRLATGGELSVVVPNPNPYLDAIQERRAGRLVVKTGFALVDGTEVLQEIAGGALDNFRYDLGSFNGSAALGGSGPVSPAAPITRKVRDISFRGMSNSGARRFRCEPDMYLKPGDTADLGDDESIVVDQVVFTVTSNQATMEISEAELDG
jgi:DNA-binding beta-propeller fold protein YncE